MAGLVPAIHVLLSSVTKDVDARPKAGHDEIPKAPDFIDCILNQTLKS